MILGKVNPSFWKNKRVFLTGHTGFKGGWLSLWLNQMGAKVTGYSLAPNTAPNLFEVLKVGTFIENSHIGDIRDFAALRAALNSAEPEIVIHMAAQPLVRYSYSHPIETYATNVMGTVHLLESVRSTPSVKATVVVTTDKCYENKEWAWGYRENEPMGGHDPYSSSKGCAELVTSAYRKSFFSENLSHKVALGSARAGNVIGGGDWSEDRLIPDAIRAFIEDSPLLIRNPGATRPWQHVLEPLSGYLTLAQALHDNGDEFGSAWNFGPKDDDARPVQEVVELLIENWGGSASWVKEGADQLHEANLLKLDCSKAAAELSWTPRWGLEKAIEKTSDWYKAFQQGEDMRQITIDQINSYQNTN
ncbi:CDP-glucose 4,6-dehydratase [Polynucleobacter asymbioticus]|nr:CDP-glucose 4,6-dehydratase [Polynucleobacter asymbioticus]